MINKNTLKTSLKHAKELFPTIVLVFRYQLSETKAISYLNGKLDTTSVYIDEGLGIHSFSKEGYMGFASTNVLTKKEIEKTVQKSIANLEFAKKNGFEKIKGIKHFKPTKAIIISPLYTRVMSTSLIKSRLEAFNKKVMSIKKPKGVNVSFQCNAKLSKLYKHILRSDGTDILYAYPYSNLRILISASRKGETQTFGIAKRGRFLDFLNDEKKILTEIKNAIALLSKLFEAPKIKPGSYNLLLDGEVGATFIHEAFGHSAEADTIKTKSPLAIGSRFRKGVKIAPRYVSIYDETSKFDRGYTPYDEYGIKRKKVFIVKDGKLHDFLSDINHYNRFPNGSSRAESYAEIPIPRMSNIVIKIKKGDSFNFRFKTLETKIEKVYNYLIDKKIIDKNKQYIYLLSCNGGEVLSEEGEFQFNADAAYLLFHGNIKLFKGVSFKGKTLAVLKSIVGGSKQLEAFPGTCGKNGQYVPVLAQAPRLLVLKKSDSIKIA